MNEDDDLYENLRTLLAIGIALPLLVMYALWLTGLILS